MSFTFYFDVNFSDNLQNTCTVLDQNTTFHVPTIPGPDPFLSSPNGTGCPNDSYFNNENTANIQCNVSGRGCNCLNGNKCASCGGNCGNASCSVFSAPPGPICSNAGCFGVPCPLSHNYNQTYSWSCFRPKSTNQNGGRYFFSSSGLTPIAAPTVFQNPNNTDANFCTFQVIYSKDNLFNTDPQTLQTLINVIATNQSCSMTINSNTNTINQMIREYCNNTALFDGAAVGSLCSLNNNCTNINLGMNVCCTPKTCQQGWLSHCSQGQNIASSPCVQFYNDSRQDGVISSNVQNMFKSVCPAMVVDSSGNLDSSITESSPVLNVCACYLGDTNAYNNFINQLSQTDPSLAPTLLLEQPQCFYPSCINSSLQPNSNQCPNIQVTTCIQNNVSNFNAGGSIKATTFNDQSLSCSTNNTPIKTTPPPLPPPPTQPPLSKTSDVIIIITVCSIVGFFVLMIVAYLVAKFFMKK